MNSLTFHLFEKEKNNVNLFVWLYDILNYVILELRWKTNAPFCPFNEIFEKYNSF